MKNVMSRLAAQLHLKSLSSSYQAIILELVCKMSTLCYVKFEPQVVGLLTCSVSLKRAYEQYSTFKLHELLCTIHYISVN